MYFFLIKLAVTNLSISIKTLVLESIPEAPVQFLKTYSDEADAVISADSPLLNSVLEGLTDPPFIGFEDVNNVCVTESLEQEFINIKAVNRNIFFILILLINQLHITKNHKLIINK